MGMLEVNLSANEAVDPRLFTLPQDRVYGDRPESELLHKRIKIQLGERPTARNLRKMFEAEGKELPADLKVYGAYEIWLIGLTVGVIREGGWKSVTRLGLQVELPTSPRFIVVGLAPETRMITRGKLGFECSATVGANGAIGIPEAISAMANLAPSASIGGEASAQVSAQGGVKLSLSVISPAVVAIGKGDRRAQWVIEDVGGPLLGDQEVCFTVLTPVIAEEIRMTARVSATIATFDLLPCLLQSGDIAVQAVLR